MKNPSDFRDGGSSTQQTPDNTKSIITGIFQQEGLQKNISAHRKFKLLCNAILARPYNSDFGEPLISESFNQTLGSDESRLHKWVQPLIKQEILAKYHLTPQYNPSLWQRFWAFISRETPEQKAARAKIEKYLETFDVNRQLLKLKDRVVPDGKDFADVNLGYEDIIPIAATIGNNYRYFDRNDIEKPYKKPDRDVYGVCDAAKVDYKDGIVVASIADGHEHPVDATQAKWIKDVAAKGCSLANRIFSDQVREYWDEVPNSIRKEVSSKKLIELIGLDGEVSSELADATKVTLDTMFKQKLRNNGESAGVTTYATKYSDSCLRVTGFSVGDQMLIAYSPDNGEFYNVARSLRAGSPFAWTHSMADNIAYTSFDYSLPSDSIIIGLTDGVFDMLPKDYIQKEEYLDDDNRSTIFESLDLDKMPKPAEDINTARDIRDFFLDLVTKEHERRQANPSENVGRRGIKNAPIGDDVTIVAVAALDIINAEKALAESRPKGSTRS